MRVATAPGLAQAYERHGGAVFGLARRLLVDRALAEEVTQEVFLRLWNRPDRFDATRGSLRSFLLADCHGRCLDLIRAESSRRHREERLAVLDLRDTGSEDIAGEVCSTEAAGQIRAALTVLSEREREAITLAYFGGNTYREVAALLHTPVGTVKSRIRAGLTRLRSELVGVSWD